MKEEDTQQDLIDYVTNDENLKKAAEGSMEKRRRVLYPEDTLPDDAKNHIVYDILYDYEIDDKALNALFAFISQHQALRDIDSRIDELKRIEGDSAGVYTFLDAEREGEEGFGWPLSVRLAELKKQRKDGDAC